nr:MAG TPA: hypothetical protein [Caudoviricetes sp.]
MRARKTLELTLLLGLSVSHPTFPYIIIYFYWIY